MNLPTIARDLASLGTRRLPQFRGMGRLCSAINGASLRLGAAPLAQARMKDGTTIVVDLRSGTERQAFYSGRYEFELVSVIDRLFDRQKCFLDVGANIGFITIAVASMLRAEKAAGKVVAFEPCRSNYERLVENIELNGLGPYCVAENLGLSDSERTSEITLREDFLQGSGTGNAAIPTSDEFDRGFRRLPIRLDRLDNLWSADRFNSLRIDLIKIDVEGHEDYCLRGAQSTIVAQRPTILIEINKPYYRARNVELERVMEGLIPPRYRRFREVAFRWKEMTSFDECQELENVIILPEEKLDMFNSRLGPI
jgi:FkbM family methyltransferase